MRGSEGLMEVVMHDALASKTMHKSKLSKHVFKRREGQARTSGRSTESTAKK